VGARDTPKTIYLAGIVITICLLAFIGWRIDDEFTPKEDDFDRFYIFNGINGTITILIMMY